MKKTLTLLAASALATLLTGCERPRGEPIAAGDASPWTIAANADVAKSLRLDDPVDFEEAKRGLIARPKGRILAADGRVLRDFDAYGFLQGEAPPTVNPSLWRHARLNAEYGLFKVTDGIYQLRGFDIANMTLIEGRTGWIVVDPLTARESSSFALAFAREQLGNKPVSAIIFTHSHADHFGGALGVLGADEAAARKVPVIASEGFMEEATSENLLAGTAMARRSLYQFGRDLPRNARGNVDTGLGKDVVYGNLGILRPTFLVTRASEELLVDGRRFVFHNVPDAEAPAELSFTLPDLRAYCGAENVTQTMHNLLPIRGAKVRNALRWSEYMDQAIRQVQGMDVLFSQHNWPVWGQERIVDLLKAHRDVYKYTHDQTVRLMNAGYTAPEIAEMVKLPQSLQNRFGARGYYGDLRHNVKAVYQFYLGNYDGNPAHLNPLPPQESAKRHVELMGGADKVVAVAQKAYDAGDYRWAAELLNQAVFADAGNTPARELLARTYEQMGYSAESSTWRNSYLTGADELRRGPPRQGVNKALFVDLLMQTPVDRFLEAMAANLNGPDAEGKDFKLNLELTDIHETYVLWIENAVLHFRRGNPEADANATLSLTQPLFVKLVAGTAGVKDTLMSDDLKVKGSRIDLVRFFSLIDKPKGNFSIVTR